MAKKRDESAVLTLRVPQSLLDRIEAQRLVLEVAAPAYSISQSDAVRALLLESLEAREKKQRNKLTGT